MNTIIIDDPLVFQGSELYARANHSSLKELVNKYVASLAAQVNSSNQREKTTKSFTDTKEFQNAMAFMDSFVINDMSSVVPIEEDGKGAIARIKYGV